LLAVIITTFGTSFRLGYNACIMNPTAGVLQKLLNNTIKNHYTNQQPIGDASFGWIWALSASIVFLGAMFGAFILILFCKNMGRRIGLIVSQVIFIIGSTLSACAYFKVFELFVLGQFVVGIALGFSASILTPYIDEISDKSYSYILFTLVAISVEIGTSIANFLGVDVILGSENLWPVAFMFPVIFNIICLIFLLLPKMETPVYLIRKDKKELALKSIQFYFRLNLDEAQEKLRQIEKDMKETNNLVQKSAWQAIKERKNRKALCISLLTTIIMNFSGILAITVYGTELMVKYSNNNNTTAGFANFGVFTASLFGLIFALFVIRNASHRLLLLIGLPAMLIVDVLFIVVMETTKGTVNLVLISALIVAFCLAFSNSIEKVTFFYGAMYTSPEYIQAVSSITVVVTYFAGFSASATFYPLNNKIGPYAFLMFIIPLAIVWVCFFIWYPKENVEPKQKPKSTIEVSFTQTSAVSLNPTSAAEETKDNQKYTTTVDTNSVA